MNDAFVEEGLVEFAQIIVGAWIDPTISDWVVNSHGAIQAKFVEILQLVRHGSMIRLGSRTSSMIRVGQIRSAKHALLTWLATRRTRLAEVIMADKYVHRRYTQKIFAGDDAVATDVNQLAGIELVSAANAMPKIMSCVDAMLAADIQDQSGRDEIVATLTWIRAMFG